ncbi:sensor histidine kinase [Terriglobus roseus]|uniref:sensor histidine kinase n=1 Tax=Terriglobus roseus TaxID=392734 RepID=UPI001E4636CF|nr:ATP-binding protein [Terriglobus roseus]
MSTIRFRLTVWYAALVTATVLVLGIVVYVSAAWGVRKAADAELTSGLNGIETFLNHKLAIHEMNNLGEELREHSSLMPRGKMFRVRDGNGVLVYQPDAMAPVSDLQPYAAELHKGNQVSDGHVFRTISRMAQIGPYKFSLQAAVDQTDYRNLINRLALLLAACLPLAGILAALGGHWMSGRVLTPVDRITATASTIDAHNLQLRLSLQGNGDELDQLSQTINSMLDRIESAYDRVAQFTADASHELRSPVAVVRSTAELLLMDLADGNRIRRGLTNIVEESDSMARLIADLLTLARSGLEANAGQRELFDLGASVSALVPRAREQASLKHIDLVLHESGVSLPVQSNQMVAERVFMILVDNAIRYTPTGGSITVGTWREDNRCCLSVTDTGIGIAPEHQSRIFDRFYRVDSARTPGDGGSGLGLAIARNLLELHGGGISVESQRGKGSSFLVWFDTSDTQAPARGLNFSTV